MANIPDPNNPTITQTFTRNFQQAYYISDDEGECNGIPNINKVSIIVDDEGVEITSEDVNSCSGAESITIATKELAIEVAKGLLEECFAEGPLSLQVEAINGDKIILERDVVTNLAHELWRLKNHITSPHGPVAPDGALELLNHVNNISEFLQITPKPKQKQ